MDIEDIICPERTANELETELFRSRLEISRLNADLRLTQNANVKLASKLERAMQEHTEYRYRIRHYEEMIGKLEKENAYLKEANARSQSLILGLQEELFFLSQDKDFVENHPPRRKQSFLRVKRGKTGNFGNGNVYSSQSRNSPAFSNRMDLIAPQTSGVNCSGDFKCVKTKSGGVEQDSVPSELSCCQELLARSLTISAKSSSHQQEATDDPTLDYTTMDISETTSPLSTSHQQRSSNSISGRCLPVIRIEDWSENQQNSSVSSLGNSPPHRSQTFKTFELMGPSDFQICLKDCGAFCGNTVGTRARTQPS